MYRREIEEFDSLRYSSFSRPEAGPTIEGNFTGQGGEAVADENHDAARTYGAFPDEHGQREALRGPDSRVGYVYHRLLAVSDLFAILFAVVVAVLVAGAMDRGPDVGGYVVPLLVMLPVWLLIAYFSGLLHQVDLQITQDYVDEMGPVIVAATAWIWLFVVLCAIYVSVGTALIAPVLTWIFMIIAVLSFRAILRTLVRRRLWNQRPVATIGDAFGLGALSGRLKRHPEWCLEVACEIEMDLTGSFVLQASTESSGEEEIPGVTGLVSKLSIEEMTSLLVDSGVERAIIAGGSGSFSLRSTLVRRLVENGIVVDYVAGGPETFYPSTSMHYLEGMTVISTRPSRQQPLVAALKRTIDVTVAACLLVVASPVLAISAIAIKLDSPGSVMFRQARCGRHGNTFFVTKLRTMEANADQHREKLRSEGHTDSQGMLKIKNDPRVTRVGAYLRSWSIDEIPQLWNVLVGDMSLVGPRPLPLDESALVTGDFKVRESMRPGVTGPWQVMGRSEIPMQDMLKLDYTYVVGWTLVEDLKLLLRTVTAVMKRTGAH